MTPQEAADDAQCRYEVQAATVNSHEGFLMDMANNLNLRDLCMKAKAAARSS